MIADRSPMGHRRIPLAAPSAQFNNTRGIQMLPVTSGIAPLLANER
jgi:hypothetical protein